MPARACSTGWIDQDKIPVFNVFQFDAFGDNSKDDTAAIQAAITAANAAGGGIVYLPSGTFRISSSVVMSSNVWLRGAGMGVTTIKWADTATTSTTIMIRTAAVRSNMVISDLTLDGNKSVVSLNPNECIGLVNPTFTLIKNVRCTQSGNFGIRLKNDSLGNVTDCVIDSCIIDNFGSAGLANAFGIIIQSTQNTNGNARNTVSNCIVKDSTAGTVAFGIWIESNYSSVSGCSVYNMQPASATDSCVGIGVGKSISTSVSDNNLADIYGEAIEVANTRISGSDTTFVNSSCSVTGNTANNCRYGLESSGPSDLTCVGNSFTGGVAIVGAGAAEGIEINDDSLSSGTFGPVTIVGNTVSSFAGAGIFVGNALASLTGCTIANNIVLSASKRGISLGSLVTGSSIFNNVVYNANRANGSYDSIYVQAGAGAVSDILISGNNCFANAGNPSPYGINLATTGISRVATIGNYFQGMGTASYTVTGSASSPMFCGGRTGTFTATAAGTTTITDTQIPSAALVTFSPSNSSAGLLTRSKTCYLGTISNGSFTFIVSSTGAGAPAGTETFNYFY